MNMVRRRNPGASPPEVLATPPGTSTRRSLHSAAPPPVAEEPKP